MSKWPCRTASAIAIGTTLVAAIPAEARVTKLVVETIRPAPDGRSSVAYEIVTGTFHGEVDPISPGNAIITDLQYAPRNSRGLVEYSATFAIARPVDPGKTSGVLFYDVPNRGNGFVAADPDGHIRVDRKSVV